MTRAFFLLALFACCKKSSASEESAPPGPAHAEHQTVVKVDCSSTPNFEKQTFTLNIGFDRRTWNPSVELRGTKKPFTGSAEKDAGAIFIEVPFDQLGPAGTTYTVVYDTFQEHGEGTCTFDTTRPLSLAAADLKRTNKVTAQWTDTSMSPYFSADVTPDRKLVFDFTASPGATLTLDGTSKPTTAEPVRFELDIGAKAGALKLSDTLAFTVKLEDPSKRVLERPFLIKARVLFEVLVTAKPGPYLFPGEKAGPHHTIGAGVDEAALAGLELREIDRIAKQTSTSKDLPPCRYVPEGVTDPKEWERYTVHRELVTTTVSVYDRRAGKIVASKSWTGKPEKCLSSVQFDQNSRSDIERFTAGSEAEIAAFVAGVR